MEHNVVAIIPARMDSVRFPGKILKNILGIPMVEHVRRRAKLCNEIDEVYVATCDSEIVEAVTQYGGKIIMTSATHSNGSERVAEAIKNLECTHVIILQGDEPLIYPEHLSKIINVIKKNLSIKAWNATGPIISEMDLNNNAIVKCVISKDNRIYFCSRKSPCISDYSDQIKIIRKILGVIIFRKEFLLKFIDLPKGDLEEIEFIEQSRIIENNYSLYSIPLGESLVSINYEHELELVENILKEDHIQKSILDRIL